MTAIVYDTNVPGTANINHFAQVVGMVWTVAKLDKSYWTAKYWQNKH